MQACTFTFNHRLLLIFAMLFAFATTSSFAEDPSPPVSNNPSSSSPATHKVDEPSILEPSSPYLNYGNFDMDDDEDAQTLYYQYGRFFGISLGAGFQTALGNRGRLYQAAFPRVDFKIHYWFDFQTSLVMNLMFANHSFNYNNQTADVNLLGYGIDIKYAFDVKNSSAPIAFSNPYVFIGAGALSKMQTSSSGSATESDGSFSFNLGGGLEFPIVLRKTYFLLEARYFTQNFYDSNEDIYAPRAPDLRGGFFTVGGHLLFTW